MTREKSLPGNTTRTSSTQDVYANVYLVDRAKLAQGNIRDVSEGKKAEKLLTEEKKFMENRKRISIVMLDMIMPKKNGKEVGEAIRKVSAGVKILFASGYTMDIIKGKELPEARSDFTHKPFRPKDLLIKVREVLDK